MPLLCRFIERHSNYCFNYFTVSLLCRFIKRHSNDTVLLCRFIKQHSNDTVQIVKTKIGEKEVTQWVQNSLKKDNLLTNML